MLLSSALIAHNHRNSIPITPNAGLIIALTWKLFFHKNLHSFGLLKVFTLLMTMITCPVGLTAWWDTVLFILRQWLWQWEHVDSGVRTFKLNFDHLFTGYMILEQLNNLFIDHLHLLIRKNECTNSIYLMVLFCNDYIKWYCYLLLLIMCFSFVFLQENISPLQKEFCFSGHHCILRTQHNGYEIMKKS